MRKTAQDNTKQFSLSFVTIASVMIFISLAWTNIATGAWNPIIGIPQPNFGVNENPPPSPSPWSAGIQGFYYVCPSCAGSTDTSNPYGWPTQPRLSIPNPIPAGSVVELHGQYNGDYLTITAQGTLTLPVFLRGIAGERPTISRQTKISGSYLIIENIIFGPSDNNDMLFGLSIPETNHFITIRDCEFSGNLGRSGGITIGTWSYSGNSDASDILLHNLQLHDLGDINSPIDQDKHCVTVNGSVNNLWLVNSEMARCSGDGIQIEAQQGKRDKIHHIYVGKNTSHDHKQTGMWIKHATDVIFSENTIYGHRPGNSSFGQGTGFQYGPEYVWFLANKIYNNNVGIGISSNDPPGDGTELFIIGNLIHTIHNQTDSTDPYNTGCIMIRGGTNRYIFNNTCYDYDSGINALSSTGKYIIYNNIFSNRTIINGYDIYIPSQSSLASNLRNTLIYNSVGLRINWNGSLKTDWNSFITSTNEGTGCFSTDPRFASPASQDFHLQGTSPAIDTGSANVAGAYDTFYQRYGIRIDKDMDKRERPYGSAWDIGAYEYPPPSVPTINLIRANQ